jgi:hypothetical protein
MKRLVAFLIAALVAHPSLAKQPKAEAKTGGAEAAAPGPPEVKKTVDAFVGTWVFDGKVSGLPGAKGPTTAKETVVCRKGGGGRVASCSGKGTVSGVGPVEDEALITWDAGAGNVRFVGMSSMGDVHDHVCSWKDDRTLACEPLTITAAGQQATVDLDLTWADARHLTLRETTAVKDGSKVMFEATGTRK